MARPRKIRTTPSLVSPATAIEAYGRIEAQLAALPATDLETPAQADFSAIVLNVLGLAPRLREFRGAIADALPHHPPEALDSLEDYALALWFTNLVHTQATKAGVSVEEMGEEALKLREGLLVAAEALAHRELLDRDTVSKVQRGGGPGEVAHDLVTLGGIFTENWGRIAGKTAVEQREVERASSLGTELLLALTAKKHAERDHYDPAEQQNRAFTLLSNAYDATRRALTYLRWKEGDVESLSPALLRQKPGRKAKAAMPEASEDFITDAVIPHPTESEHAAAH